MKQSRIKELIKTTGILMFARICTQIVSFLLLPLYTALLTTSEYGQIDLISTLSMIIVPFLTLQLEMGLFRYFITSDEDEERQRIVSTTVLINIIIYIGVSTAFLIINIFIYNIQHGFELMLYYILIAVVAVFLQLCRAQGKTIAYGIANFMASAISIALNVLFIAVLHLGVLGVIWSTNISYLVTLVFLLITTHVRSYFSIKYYSKKWAKTLLSYSVPLIFNQISSWLINYSDRLIILHFWGLGSNGIYSLACKFSNITSAVFGVYNTAWTENVVRSLNDEDRDIYLSRVFNYTFTLYLLLISIIVSILPLIFEIFIRNPEYYDAYPHIPILLLAMFFSGMAATLGSIYIALGKTKEVSITTALAGVCNIIVHFSLLSNFKLYAASISTLVSFALLLVYRVAFIKKVINIKYDLRNSIIFLLLFCGNWIAYSLKCRPILIALAIMDTLFLLLYLRKFKMYFNNETTDVS